MTTQEVRMLVLEWLKAPGQEETMQFLNCSEGINRILESRLVGEPRGTRRLFGHNEADYMALASVIWDLIFERVLVPGRADNGWPFFSITEHGRKVIKEMKPTPYDPDGSLKRLKDDSPSIHSTVIRYVQEAIATFRTGNYLAAAVMLGAASEKLFDELADTLPNTLADTAAQSKLASKMRSGKMRDRLNTIVGWCRNNRTHLPGAWSGEEQTDDIQQIANLIRRRRNEAGHPTDPPPDVSHEQMYAYIMAFPDYCKSIYILKDWADKNPGVVK